MKRCNDCGQEKPLTEFYKHPDTADGHLNSCKTCRRNYSNTHRREIIDVAREYDRNRSQLSHRQKHLFFNTKQWREQNPEKYQAHLKVNNAVRSGKLIKPDQCNRCKRKSTIIHGHHADYSKPLDVEWLCPACHGSEIAVSI